MAAPASAAGKKVALTMVGASLQGTEFNDTFYRNSCLKNSGWDTYAINSGASPSIPRSTESQKNIDDALAAGGAKTPKWEGGCPEKRDSPAEQKAEGIRFAEKYKEYIKQVGSSLSSGDQFLLQVNAHGSSDCQANRGLEDTTAAGKSSYGYDFREGGVRDIGTCKHWFQVVPPGCTNPIWLPSSAIAEALKPLADKGVKTAVDLRSCFAGAALKEFADQGICAHAYATADVPLMDCAYANPESPDNQAASATTLTTAYMCRDPKAQASFSKVKQALKGADSSCTDGALDLLQKNSKLKDGGEHSLSQIHDATRELDGSANEPAGTDGPYWTLNSLSFFMYGADELGRGHEGKEICYLPEDYNAFESQLTKHLDEVTKKALGDSCDLSAKIKDFISANKSSFAAYYDGHREQVEATNRANALTAGLAESAEGKALAAELAKALYPDPSKAGSVESTLQVGLIAASSPVSKNAARNADREKALALMEKYLSKEKTSKLLADYERVSENRIKAFQKAKKSQKAIIPLERKLYSQIKNSPEYKACLEKGENASLRKARQACENFKL